jgi:hypothetical protein
MRWLFLASLAGVVLLMAIVARARLAGGGHEGDSAGTAA